MMTSDIELIEFTKRYGGKVAVDAVTLTIPCGAVCCLLGPNGAGKTTTLETLMSLRTPTSGAALLRGVDVRSPEIRSVYRHVGFLAEEPMLYEYMTAREFLRFLAELYNVGPTQLARTEALLPALGMAAAADTLIGTYSHGMRKKIAFLAALINDPAVLILDEPTNAMDAPAAQVVKSMMRQFATEGRTVLFTTHVMEIAERWADRFAILSAGRLVFNGELREMRECYGRSSADTLETMFMRAISPVGVQNERLAIARG